MRFSYTQIHTCKVITVRTIINIKGGHYLKRVSTKLHFDLNMRHRLRSSYSIDPAGLVVSNLDLTLPFLQLAKFICF